MKDSSTAGEVIPSRCQDCNRPAFVARNNQDYVQGHRVTEQLDPYLRPQPFLHTNARKSSPQQDCDIPHGHGKAGSGHMTRNSQLGLAGQTAIPPLIHPQAIPYLGQHTVCFWKFSIVRFAVNAGIQLNFLTKVSTSRARRPLKGVGTSSIPRSVVNLKTSTSLGSSAC